MNIITHPSRNQWQALFERPRRDASELTAIVSGVLERVRTEGDKAVKAYELEFDKVELDTLEVSEAEIDEAEGLVSQTLRDALALAHANITKFHASQSFESKKVETAPGVVCWQKSVPIQKVGLYVPGGTAPLFSTVLMLATPARIAGCEEIVLCTPPDREGKVHPAILVAARMAGVSKIYKAGGIQAIGAMAYGTESVPKVSKIFGPGNQYVMAAKQQVSLGDVAIDMPAGPSEVAIVADGEADPAFVAADLLSQAEHGADSQALLITTSAEMATRVSEEVSRQVTELPRHELAEKSLQHSKIVVARDIDEAVDMANEYAPEHLILAVGDYMALADRVVNAGSVFLGRYSCESAGDYASGTNHTLPTSGYAKAYSGVNLDSFCRKITFQELTEQGVRSIGPAIETMAEAELLFAHRNAMTLRLAQVGESTQ